MTIARFASLSFVVLALGCGGHAPPPPEIPPVQPAPAAVVPRTCGGNAPEGASNRCSDDEFCEFAPDAACGAADATGTCRVKPRVCTRELHPVCGCDGQTYPTGCVANSGGVSVAHDGECPPPPPEGLNNPCGSRGLAECPEGLFCQFTREARCGQTDHPGSCQVKPEACTMEMAEVCGCNGTTYPNECAAHAAGTSVSTDGACPPARSSRRPRPAH